MSIEDTDYDLAHARLFEKMNLILKMFYSKKIEDIKNHLIGIRAMAVNHFNDEESVMQQIEFPLTHIHKAAHNLILFKIDAILESNSNIGPLLENLAFVLSEHVEHYDTIFMEYKNMVEEIINV